jgi:hypothetical protein
LDTHLSYKDDNVGKGEEESVRGMGNVQTRKKMGASSVTDVTCHVMNRRPSNKVIHLHAYNLALDWNSTVTITNPAVLVTYPEKRVEVDADARKIAMWSRERSPSAHQGHMGGHEGLKHELWGIRITEE